MTFGLNPLLLVTFFPLIGFVIIAFLKDEQKDAIRWTALATSLVTFVISLLVLAGFDRSNAGMQMVANYPVGNDWRFDH